MVRAISLLSGGLDSFVSTAIAYKKHKVVLALTFDYGQRAACREILAARKMCRMWHIPHKVIELPWLGKITDTALVNRKLNLPCSCHPEALGPKDPAKLTGFFASCLPAGTALRMIAGESAQAVWVPNRNALFINIAAAFAESLHSQLIVTGFNKEEGATFPDNSAHFVEAINRTLKLGTLPIIRPEPVEGRMKCYARVISFVQQMTKRDMVRYALRRKLPLDICWPCYEGGKRLCGRCESCVRFLRACHSERPARRQFSGGSEESSERK